MSSIVKYTHKKISKYNCIKNIIDNLSVLFVVNKSNIISVDGVDCSGKSYLSKLIVNENNYSYIDIDGDYFRTGNFGRNSGKTWTSRQSRQNGIR
jgi:hypothetical protein